LSVRGSDVNAKNPAAVEELPMLPLQALAKSSIYFSIPRSIITAISPPMFFKMNARPFCRISFAKNEDALATRLHPQTKIDIEQGQQSPIRNRQFRDGWLLVWRGSFADC
jgi:hypothetical protein